MSQKHPINIELIDHVVLRARNLERMIDFYSEVLGCRVERGPGKLGLVQLRAGKSLIDLVDMKGSLGQQGGNAPDPNARNMDHFCLLVEPWDADVLKSHLEKNGVEVGDVYVRYGAVGNGPSLYIRDPEGNTVELKGRGHS